MFVAVHVGQAAASAFVKAESALWKSIIANLGNLTNS